MDVVRLSSDLSLLELYLHRISRRNTVVLDFITWLRQYNEHVAEQKKKKKVGFFGVDLYSLQASRDEVIKYLEKNQPGLSLLGDAEDSIRSSRSR